MDEKKALNKAMALCAKQEYCTGDVREKLMSWGLTAEASEKIVNELVRQDFINDLRYVLAYVNDKLRFNQWGKTKIRYMLSVKGIHSSIISEALTQVDETLYTTILSALLPKKSNTLRAEKDQRVIREKLIRFAAGRGFEPGLIVKFIQEGNPGSGPG